MREGELSKIPQKGGGAEKRGEETKILKRVWGKLGQGGGALKGGLEPPYKL